MSELSDQEIVDLVNIATKKIGPAIWNLFQAEFSKEVKFTGKNMSLHQRPIVTSTFITVLFMWGINDHAKLNKTLLTSEGIDKFLDQVARLIKNTLLIRKS